ASVTEKDTFTVAVRADTLLTGWDVTAFRMYITYSPTYFEFLGMEGAGPVLSGWGAPEINSANAGTLIIGAAGADPLTGSGEMIYLRFRSNRSGNSTISFNSSESYLNEGNPASAYSGGTVSSAALSYPNIYPDQQNMYIGDEVQMSVSGGTAPFVYSTDNPAVAVVSDVDRVRAVGPGTTRVRVVDDKGEESVTSGIFDVRAIRTDMEEVSVWPADTFYVPVKLEVASGTTVYSGRFELDFGSGLTGISGEIIQGDFQVMMENNVKSGRMTVSFASTAGITGDGLLGYLRFRANSSGNQYVRFENVRFNETLRAWPVKTTYYMNVRSLPNLSMSPSSGTLMWGETVKLNVSNGTAPYSYSVSDPSVATIDEQGNLSAITGGTVRVTATDENGATMTSGVFTVTDSHVSVYPTEGILDSETRVPIFTSSLPSGKAIYGYQAAFSFNETYLEFVGVEPAGSNALVDASQNGNSVQVAAAMSQGVSTGLLGYLVFDIRQELALDATTNISFNSFSANENQIISTREGGTVRRVEQTSYRPVAIAGLNFSLQEGTVGVLDGSASFDLDDDPLTYLWT
ncbi:MAG: Ig-like domain-containing protein, partial [Bacteroidales bacterium]|nr:Ig-like domain-containing protein [Bacteroidales bacterium]